jgi:hypothetical protein
MASRVYEKVKGGLLKNRRMDIRRLSHPLDYDLLYHILNAPCYCQVPYSFLMLYNIGCLADSSSKESLPDTHTIVWMPPVVLG